eukprot:3906332-Rhodomonas_salina.1
MDEENSQTKGRQSFNFRKEKWQQLARWVIETEPRIRKALRDASLPSETGNAPLSALAKLESRSSRSDP